MSALQITVSDEISRAAERLASNRGMTVEQFAEQALAAQVVALSSTEYWKARAARGNPGDFIRLLRLAPDAPPVPGDELPSELARWVEKEIRHASSQS